jgi:hypothetical protein
MRFAPKGNTMRIDLKARYSPLYTATRVPEVVEAPRLFYLMIDGVGEPATSEFTSAVKALYGLAYGIKSSLKPEIGYSVMPLEARWGTGTPTDGAAPTRWTWTLQILQPSMVTVAAFDEAVTKLRKTQHDLPVDRVRLGSLIEGTCAQVLHIGPYSAETETVSGLLSFIDAHGYRPSGLHHEIYLSDPNRTVPDRLKTILRLPIAPTA